MLDLICMGPVNVKSDQQATKYIMKKKETPFLDLNFCRHLVIFCSKNMCQKEPHIRSSTVI